MAWAENASNAASKFASLSITRQLGLMLGLAASVAIGVAVVLWSREPSYMPLFNQLSSRDSADVVDVLQRNRIPFRIDESNGMVMVSASDVQNARIKLAAEGLPHGTGNGFELFAGGNAFNSSQFMENARYKQALETELARTISQFHDIKSARVHLAIPRESAFVRDNRQPSASVFIDVYSGLELNKQTIASIINLVASSIPSLSSSRVTVVDQNGQLLSEGGGRTLFSNTERLLDYRQSLEHQYAQKIQDILTPLLGYGRVSAKVSADLDFTSFEQTQEMYNPESPSIRSEQMVQDQRSVGENASGVAGALSNKPPAKPNLAPANNNNSNNNDNNNTQNTNEESLQASDIHKASTKNFELDKTISHTRNQPGSIKRLTIAVLVDNRPVFDPKTKKTDMKPLTKKEITQIKTLVADAIGYNPERGDSLNVVNSHFVKPDPIEMVPAPHFWQRDWFWSVVKQVLGALFLLGMVFGVFRPLFKTLATSRTEEESETTQKAIGYQGQGLPPDITDYEGQLQLLRQVVDKEPKRVAQVVKTWVDRG
ncbi:flagellar basal-body MS-ring/collar protein FliF [Legionella spiritensis]|uniref:Flagellar M-ring protein n=1 Tax=Legionella spiritensis TaxID=452 RepID=A0A0W0ZA15_LEGSP|nr:flagellar basal-body MS-ring/collar protein FliF [Legionella spiritensis]KTD65779.1 flagellar MS-ring protein [Legionella spiritensis]SNV41389.1 flagellar M-ring protein FliF [Legionella spiritensis]